MQKPEPVFVTAGVEQPTDLTAHMAAGIVASTLALHRYGRLSRIEALANVAGVRGLYNVTAETGGVLKHYRSLWRSDSFYDDKLWAVSSLIHPPACEEAASSHAVYVSLLRGEDIRNAANQRKCEAVVGERLTGAWQGCVHARLRS